MNAIQRMLATLPALLALGLALPAGAARPDEAERIAFPCVVCKGSPTV